MAGPFIVPQSGGAITISSTAAGFTQQSNPYQYYLNSGGNSQQSDKYTFTFADGGSFYLTDFSQTDSAFGGNALASSSIINVAGIPSNADTGYGSIINVIGGRFGDFNTLVSTYDIYDATNNVRLVDNFKPQGGLNGAYGNPIANFEYSSGTLTVRTPTNSSTVLFSTATIGSAGTVSYTSAVTGY